MVDDRVIDSPEDEIVAQIFVLGEQGFGVDGLQLGHCFVELLYQAVSLVDMQQDTLPECRSVVQHRVQPYQVLLEFIDFM